MKDTIKQRRHLAGMTLIELMVALGIGSFLMIGAVTVYMESRSTFRVTESVARLQENARFTLDRLEPDIRMASYWGLTTRPSKVQGRATPAEPVVFAVANDCTPNFSVNLDTPIGGTNNIAGFPAPGCASAFSAAAQAGSDTLVIRRGTEDEIPAAAIDDDRLYVQSARFQDSQIFLGVAGVPAGYPAGTSQTHTLVVSGYYVSRTSSLSTPGNLIPSLRVKTLGTGPAITDQEVLPGVEDMQVQYGVDTDPLGAANRGSIDRYVNAGDPLLNPALNPDVEILAVRIWLRVRAERREGGFADTTNYVYADQNVAAPNDEFRRVLVSKTIYLRNTRPPT